QGTGRSSCIGVALECRSDEGTNCTLLDVQMVALKGKASLCVLVIKLRGMIFIEVVGNLHIFTRKQEHGCQITVLCHELILLFTPSFSYVGIRLYTASQLVAISFWASCKEM